MRKIFLILALLTLTVLLSGCQSGEPLPPPPPVAKAPVAEEVEPTSWVFSCDDGYTFTVHFEGDDAVIVMPDRTLTLPRAISGSGARYSDGETTFWTKGDNATLEIGGVTHEACAGTLLVEGDGEDEEDDDEDDDDEVEDEDMEGMPPES